MQISDMLGEYNRNIATNTDNLNGVKGVQQLVSSLKGLPVGNIFEGTVNSIKNGQVTLGLSNGQVITARMDGKLALSTGQSMFFQVKSNDGVQIAIRPYTGFGNAGNPTLVTALTAAGLPVSEKNLVMVNTMMEEQMSIDKNSLNEMVKTILNNENVDVKTAVQMTKAGLPVSESMAAQFENYKADGNAIVKELGTLIDDLPDLLKNNDFSARQLIDLNHVFIGEDTGTQSQLSGMENLSETVAGQPGVSAGEADSALPSAQTTMAPEQQETTGNMPAAGQGAVQESGMPSAVENGAEQAQKYPEGTVGNLLNSSQAAELTKQLSQIPELAVNGKLFWQEADGDEIVDHLNLKMPVSEFLQEVDATLQKAVENGTLGNRNLIGDTALLDSLKHLLGGKEYKTLLKGGLEQQWLLKPQDLREEHKVEELYERLNQQMEKLESTMKELGLNKASVMDTITDVRNNMEFMNQLNQMYTYVQIPLKMAGQQANADLYVYTNKKRLHDPEGELTAFLHLDLKNLGETDVSVRMQPATKQVKTNFYLKDDAAYDLIERNLPVLEYRLKKKGYQCEVTVVNEAKRVNFVEDFLKKDQKTTGTVHRYSFDVRA